jgi:acyl dehydratase
MPSYDDVEVGQQLPPQDYVVTRTDLVRYCGASGDVNVIHWNERIALAVGLPGVIAHGMFTMAEAGRYVTDWAGDPGRVVSFGTRFSRPVVVPDDDQGATVRVSAKVTAKEDGLVTLALTATTGEEPDDVRVLSGAKAVVRLV